MYTMARSASTHTLLLLSRAGATTLVPRASASASSASKSILSSRPPSIPLPLLFSSRPYHTTPRLTAYKDDQDRNTLKPRPSDATKSGSDDDVATKSSDAAFNSNNPAGPQEALASSQREAQQRRAEGSKNGDPLEVSGANPEVSKPPEAQDPENTKGKERGSGWKQAKKHGRVAPM
ncbi:hypothetical protein VTJ83DRAFT_7287 [Remersonia thermophila]|uniref:Uncharacterized protein n=1 Tax=Remersonia thermophila TaxID=72144 RepID=A0ABR4D3A3_9PEZI